VTETDISAETATMPAAERARGRSAPPKGGGAYGTGPHSGNMVLTLACVLLLGLNVAIACVLARSDSLLTIPSRLPSATPAIPETTTPPISPEEIVLPSPQPLRSPLAAPPAVRSGPEGEAENLNPTRSRLALLDQVGCAVMARLLILEESPGLELTAEQRMALRRDLLALRTGLSPSSDADRVVESMIRKMDAVLDAPQRRLLDAMKSRQVNVNKLIAEKARKDLTHMFNTLLTRLSFDPRSRHS
jgi:hypothetical protein